MKKNIPLVTLIFLLIVLSYLVLENKSILFKTKALNETKNAPSVTIQKTADKYNLPVKAESPNVTAVLIHYFFSGKLRELKKVETGTQIIYENADLALPALVATSRTRISKITPPYDKNNVRININELHPGQTIGISAEFDIKLGIWSLLDVYLATDKN